MVFDPKENFKYFIQSEGLEDKVSDWVYVDKGIPLNSYLDRVSPSSYVDRLGAWTLTEEGHDFWRNIHKRWNNICSKRKPMDPNLTTLKSIW